MGETAADNQTDTLLGATPEEWSNYTDKLVSEYEPLTEVTFKDVATFVAEMTPIIGDAMAAKDVYEELKKEEPNYYLVGALGGATLIGLIPGLGDAAAKAIKKGAKEVFDVAKRVEIDPNAVGSLGGNVRLKPSGKPIKNPPRFNEEALRAAASQNDKSREILVEMPIEDFLQAAEKDFSAKKLENTRKLVSEGKPFESVPLLSFKNNADGTGKVTGHDGRHRAIALREQGETTIPVRLISEGGDGPGIRWGQQNDPDSFDYVDVIPQKLIEEDGTSLVNMPEKAANIRLTKNTTKKQKSAEGAPVSNLDSWSKGAYFKDPETGQPQRMYHGMGGTLRGEPVEFIGENLEPSYHGTLGPGTYLTKDPSVASDFATGKRGGYTDEKFGGQMFPVYTNVTKVVDDTVINSNKELRQEIADLIEDKASETDDPYIYNLADKLRTDENINLSSLFTRVEDGKIRSSGVGSVVSDLLESKGYEGISVTTDKGFHEAVIFPGHGGLEYPRQNIKSSLQGPDGSYSRESNNMSFAEGGEVKTMEEQMNLFEAGGLADDGMEREPVTGNKIPPGSMASEVRDDVPAQLSEGEYVVPADVVRYFGVKFFEDLRGKAKSDMMEMEAEGRIGGTPVDTNGIPLEEDEALTPEEEAMLAEAMAADQPQGMASGGVVKGFSDGGLPTTSSVPTSPYSVGGAYNTAGAYGSVSSAGGFEARQYVDTATGQTRTFQFLNGKPISFIPKNFVPATQATLEQAQNAETTQSQGTGVNTGSFSGGGEGPANDTNNNPNSSTSEQGLRGIDVNDPLSGVSDTISNAGRIGSTLGGLAGMVAGFGPFGGRAGSAIGKGLGTADALSDAAAQISVAEALGYDVTDAQAELDKALDGLKGLTKSGTLSAINNQTESAMDALFDIDSDFNMTDPATDPNSVFTSTEAFETSMEANAPKGYSYNKEDGSYTANSNKTTAVDTSLRPQARPENLGSESTSSTSSETNIGNYGGDRDNDGVPNVVDFNDGVGWADTNTDGGGDSDGASVICTALHAMGRLDDDIYALDSAYGVRISVEDPALRLGYHRWATPFAHYIQGDSLGSKIALEFTTPIARAWAQQMAHQMAPEDYKPHKLGKFLQVVGHPICRALGKSKQEEINGF